VALVKPDPDGGYLRALLDTDFTAEQLAIATHPLGPQLVVAGAGSGKTAVMAARVVHLVAHQGVAPSTVLGLTFTNKAAGELADRVRTALATLREHIPADRDDETGDDLPTVATYHAYAAGVVRDHALRIGREPQTQLLSEATRWQLAMRVVRRARGPFTHLPWIPSTVAQRVLQLDGEMAEHLVSVQDVRAYDADLIARVAVAPKPVQAVRDCAAAAQAREELLTLVEAYRAEKEELDLLDFGDQVALAARIAGFPEVVALERARFSVVVLDEYQDTGVAQRLLLQRLFGSGHAVTAVGDPNQAIYGWRGASVGNLLGFGEHFEHEGMRAKAQALMTSFRCGGRILDVANVVARRLLDAAVGRGRRHLDVRPLGPVESRREAGEVVVSLHDSADDEARWLAVQVAAAHAEGTAWGEIAVLCRRRVDFAVIHQELTSRGIPAEVVGLGGLLEMPEVADIVATLRVLVDPVANPALVRLLTGPRLRIGARDLAALGHRAHRLTRYGAHEEDPAEEPIQSTDPLVKATESVDPVDVVSLLDAIESPGPPDLYSPEALSRFALLREELRRLRPLVGQPIVEVVTGVVRTTGLGVEIESDTRELAQARAANVAAFLDHAAHFTGLEGESDLRAFLAYLDAAADAEDGLDIGGISAADSVKLLTIHKAKGLEWDVVALPSLSSEVFPSKRGRSRPTANAHVLPYSLRGDADDLPGEPELTSAGLKAFKGDCRSDDADEESRLLYVALTRARHRVLASGSHWTGTRATVQGPSDFLTELRDQPHVREDGWCTEPSAENPLAVAARAEVEWPRPYDPDVVRRRRHAADRVRALLTAETPSEVTPARGGPADGWAREATVLLDELRRERSAERVVPLPRRLTASQVVALAHDPDELARRLARPMPSAPVRQARRGTRFHAWVESLFGERALLEADDLPGAGDVDVSDAELRELQESFLAGEWGARRPVAIEAPFELVLGGRLVRGRIDAVYQLDDGSFDVIDYKTGEVPRDFAAASMQLSVYRLAWAGLSGIDPGQINAGFLYVRTGELKRPVHLLSHEELAELLGGRAPAPEQLSIL
jgi:DNA helicase-2/ATP-dependent DNA helicase PcrA